MAFDPVSGAKIADELVTAGQKWKWFRDITFGQVLILLVLALFSAAIYFGGRYVVDTAVPSHLKSIQVGYEAINLQNTEDRKVRIEMAREAHKQAADSNEHWQTTVTHIIEKMDKKDQFIQDLVTGEHAKDRATQKRTDDAKKRADDKEDRTDAANIEPSPGAPGT